MANQNQQQQGDKGFNAGSQQSQKDKMGSQTPSQNVDKNRSNSGQNTSQSEISQDPAKKQK